MTYFAKIYDPEFYGDQFFSLDADTFGQKNEHGMGV
jgi:hypothetical protein